MEMDLDSVTSAYSIDEERASPSSLAHVIDSPEAEETIFRDGKYSSSMKSKLKNKWARLRIILN